MYYGTYSYGKKSIQSDLKYGTRNSFNFQVICTTKDVIDSNRLRFISNPLLWPKEIYQM